MTVMRTALMCMLTFALWACDGGAGGKVAQTAAEPGPDAACALDGMLLADFPGPKAQIHYVGVAEPDYFCDTVEMFHLVLAPEQVRAIAALYVQDMGAAEWDAPVGHWIDAKQAWYVVGSKRLGSMGPTIASFAREADARRFADEHGGAVHAFAAITADMAVLDGGALHDQHM
ncbi:MAG: nitrous oxide reductase accessory protein NosL [Gammaproteobacteria bacterium]